MKNKFKIKDRLVGQGCPPYFIADIGANHEGSLERAFMLIELAKQSGADAAKFQNFKASKIVSKKGFEQLPGQISHQSSWNKSVFEVYVDASIETGWTESLRRKCDEVGIDYFTSPYDKDSVDLVDPFVDLFKIGSGDITWPEIVDYIASKKKAVIVASGASTLQDVERVMNILTKHDVPICLMQCNTNYTLDPKKYSYVNLNVLKTYQRMYPNVVLGLSDHTQGHATVAGAIALGASMIEKHFTDDNSREGPDHKFAMDPSAWRRMVDVGNEVFESLGDGIKRIEENELESIIVQQRCLRAATDLNVGEIVNQNKIEALRPKPFGSFEPYRINELLGKRLTKPIKQGEHFRMDHFNL